MLIVEIRGDQVWRRIDAKGIGAPLPTRHGEGPEDEPAPADCTSLLTDWARRYGRAVAVGSEVLMQRIGTEIHDWLDQGSRLDEWLVGRERVLEIRADPQRRDALTEALLAAPWEVLARDGVFLAEDRARLFIVARRCGGSEEPVAPRHSDLSLMFMAAAPEGQSELDYEAEEAAILEATNAKDGRPPLAHVQVEESGALELLAERIRLDGPFDAVHVSCHGDILPAKDRGPALPHPVLLLETPMGGADLVDADDLIGHFLGRIPPLIFVSACRTAELGSSRETVRPLFAGGKDGGVTPASTRDNARHGWPDVGGTRTGASDAMADPFVRQLSVQAPNVLGWDGSVFDADATLFAQSLYGELARGETVPRAVAVARRALFALRPDNPSLGQHWHLARVYLGPGGGGPLCDPTLQRRPAPPDPELPFLDKKKRRVPVATRAEFVGRRRQIQTVLRNYRDGTKGVLIHGMGNLGKSSLAARIAARMPRHRVAVVFGKCHAMVVLEAFARILEEIADGIELDQAQRLLDEVAALRRQVASNEEALEDAVRRLLRGVLNTHPVLLILDDLEQALEPPDARRPEVLPAKAYRGALGAVLGAFEAAATESRLLVTSRYDFALPDGSGGDLTAGLMRLPLAPMRPRERQKLWRARTRLQKSEATAAAAPLELVEAALDAAAGNPGLQEVLTRPLLKGEANRAGAKVAAIEAFRATGALPPDDADLGDFFGRMAFETYAAALSPTDNAALSAAALFTQEIPVPRAVLEAVAAASGIADPRRALDRLLALGILDDWGELRAWPGRPAQALAINPLARQLANPLGHAQTIALATAALPPMLEWLTDDKGNVAAKPQAEEVIRLAMLIPASKVVARCAAAAAESVRERTSAVHRLAAIFWQWITAHDGEVPTVTFLSHVVDALRFSGREDPGAGRSCLDFALESFETRLPLDTEMDRCGGLMLLGAAFENRSDYAKALSAYREFERRARFHERHDAAAMAASLSARVLMETGDAQAAVDAQRAAVALHEKSRDAENIATAKKLLAAALCKLRRLDEALRILVEDVIPVYKAHDDKRAVADAQGQIADILVQKGDLDAALKIRQEDEIPVYQALDDKRAVAVTQGQIADILVRKGALDAALKIRRQAVIPVLKALGDKHAVAIARGRVADILTAQGALDAALKIRQEDEIPVYQAVDDQHNVAITQGQIADILVRKGALDAALKIWQEAVIPIFKVLDNKPGAAMASGRVADILAAQGDLDAALKIRQEDVLPVYKALDDKRTVAITQDQIADVLVRKGALDAALKIRQEEVIPVLQALDDQRAVALAKGKVADILVQQGALDTALTIREEDEIPVYAALGDRRAVAITHDQIADILVQKGDLDAALKIRQENVIPVFESLDDQRAVALAKGKVADILVQKGDLGAALRIWQEAVIPVYDALHDKRAVAIAKGKVADILTAQGDLDAALRIRRDDEIPVYDALDDKRAVAITRGQIADILAQKGELDAALALHLERLPIAQDMGDAESLAHIRLSSARIRLARGGHEASEAGLIRDELAEAFEIGLDLQRPDFIGPSGMLLGRILAADGVRDRAVQVLQAAEAAFANVGQPEVAAECRTLIQQIAEGPE
jgi:ATP/maltotriose-dependent transcriptional regulator MalT